jgi:acyl carrier protein
MESSRAPVKASLRQFVMENLALGKVGGVIEDDASLIDNGVIDSLGIFQLVSFLEQSYGVRVRDEEIVLENFRSINAIDEFLVAKLAGKGTD